jgi:hypothetical protein
VGEEAAEASSSSLPTVLIVAKVLVVVIVFSTVEATAAVLAMEMSVVHLFSDEFRHNEISDISKYARFQEILPKNMPRGSIRLAAQEAEGRIDGL